MPRYRATIHVNGVDGETPSAARAAVEAQLKQSGLENCRVVSVDPEGLTQRPVHRPAKVPGPDAHWRRQSNAGGLLLVAAVAWAIWFFWWMLSNGHE
jgi:ferric-dicitrate binding protein FerR (iron transport regulator)